MGITDKRPIPDPSLRFGHAGMARRRLPAAGVRRAAAALLAAGAVLCASHSNAQPPLSVTIKTDSERVFEGQEIRVTATLSASSTALTVPLTVTDEYNALTSGPSAFNFPEAATSTTATFTTDDNALEDGSREVTFTLQRTTEVQLGSPSSVSVWVEDNDESPGPPRNVSADPGVDSIRLRWDPPAYNSGRSIDYYEYRRSPNDGVTWPLGWIRAPGGSLVRSVGAVNLTGGTEYTFEVRAVSNRAGKGAVSRRVKASPFDLRGVGFEIVLSSSMIVEGGGVAGTVRTRSGATFTGPVTLTFHWGDDLLTVTDLLTLQREGPESGQATLEAGTSSVPFQLAAEADDLLYSPPLRRKLQILTAREVLAATDLTLVDDEPVPVATIFAEPTAVAEGESFEIGAALSQEVHGDFVDEPMQVTATGDTDVIDGAHPAWTVDTATSARTTVATLDDAVRGGARSVTYTLARSPDSPYTLGGDAASVTVTVLDNDAPPGPPRNLVTYAGDAKASLAWEAPANHGDTAITRYQYRSGSDVTTEDDMGVTTTTFTWGAWTDVPGGDGSTRSAEVTSLTNDTEYTFEARAVNTNGESAPSNQAVVTPMSGAVALTWELSLSADTIRQGGADVEATVRIATGPAFDADQQILLTWDECWIGADEDIQLEETPCVSGHVRARGAGDYTTWLVIPAGQRSATLTLTAPPRDDQLDSYYAIHYDTDLVATFGETEIGLEPLTWADAAAKPDLSLEALSGLEVVEGEAIDMKLAFSGKLTNLEGVRISVTDAAGVLERPLPGNQVSELVRRFHTRDDVRFTLQSKDSTAANAARAVTVAHSYDGDRARYFYELVGAPVTVSVLDRDTAANAPQNFEVEPSAGAVLLHWAAPAANGAAVEKYQFQESIDGGNNYGSWTDIPDSDADTTSYRRDGRTNGTAYTYQVRAFNRFGGGMETAAMTATPQTGTWSLALRPANDASQVATTIMEHGVGVRVHFRAAGATTFDEDLTFDVRWAGAPVDADNLVRGADSTTIVIRAGEVFGSSLLLRAPDNPEGEVVYRPGAMETLTVEHGGHVVAQADLTLVDNDPKPVVTLRLSTPRALEGRSIAYFADLTGKISQEVRVTAEVSDDPDGSLVNNDSFDFRVPAGDRSDRHLLGIPQDGIANGARMATVTLTSNHADAVHYELGEPTALTALVVDDDVLPDQPAGLAAEAGPSQVTLTWDAPTGSGGVAFYQYRVSDDDGDNFSDWTRVPGDGAMRSQLVRNLLIGTEYTFELRAKNNEGFGPESDRAKATPIVGRDWFLEVAPGVLTEGGGDVTATVRFDGAVFETAEVVALEFGGEAIGGTVAPGSLIEGQDAATYVRIARGERQATLALAPAWADDARFSPRQAFELAAVHGGVTVATVTLALVDDETPPAVNLEAAETTVSEGDTIELTARLQGGLFAERTEVVFNTADAAGALSSTPGGVFEFEAGDTTSTLTYATEDKTNDDSGAVEVVFTAAAKAGAYVLGAEASVTVTVLDKDSQPGAPEGFAAGGAGTTSIGLSWDAPTRDVVTRYEFRQRPVGGSWGVWTEITDSGAGEANRTSFTVTGLAAAQPYDFELHAVNANGAGPAAGPVRASSVELEWALDVTSASIADANPQVVEGGDSLTVRARITSGGPLGRPLQVKLLWEGTEVGATRYPGSLLEGTGDDHFITIGAGSTSGQITVRARQDELYVSRIAGLLEGWYFTTVVGSETIGYRDDEAVPVASIAAAPATVTEGDAITVTVTTTQASLREREFALDITDDDGVLTSTAAGQTTITLAAGQTSANQSYATALDTTAAAGERAVVFALQADASGLDHYALDAAASSATVLVFDDDVAPEQPTGLGASPSGGVGTQMTLSWDPATVVEVDAWQVRHREASDNPPAWNDSDWADVTPVAGTGGKLAHTVEGLTVGQAYDFQVRGRNTIGHGNPAQVTESTVVLEWAFRVTPSSTDADGDPQVVEGGASVVVEAEITMGGPLDGDQTVKLFWGGTPVGGDEYPGSLLEGAAGAHEITIAGGATSGQITVRGRQDDRYASREKAGFEGRFNTTKIGETTVSYEDDEPVPVASIAAVPTTVTEGDATTVTVTTTRAAVLDRAVALDITDAAPVLTSAAAAVTEITIAAGQTTANQSYATVGDSTASSGERAVVFALEADASGLGHYDVDAAASTATVVVLDDDAVPEVPGRFRANPSGQTAMTLSWDASTIVEVDTWQVRHRTAGESAPDWNESDWTDVTPTAAAGGRSEHALSDLTVGVTYDFQVRGQNQFGNGEPATATRSTVVVDWAFTVTPASRDEDGDPQVVEGGASLTVTAEILSGGSQLDGDQTVKLFWDGTEVAGAEYPGSLLEGAAGAHEITIADGQTSGQITVRARQDNLYAGREKAAFEGRFYDTKIDDGTVSVSYLDDEAVPVASIAAAPAAVTEGDPTSVTVTTTQAALRDREFALDITDDDGLLTSASASVTAITLAGGQTSASQGYATLDVSGAQSERSIVFALVADASGASRYALDPSASAATVAVLDDDAVPEIPVDLMAKAGPGQDGVTLSWDRPTRIAADSYQVRYRLAGDNPPAWNDGDWSGVTPTSLAGGRLEHALSGLTVGATYDFQVRGGNGIGYGDPANATGSTVVLEWRFTVNGSTGGRRVVEGGANLRVKAEITNGQTLVGDQQVSLYWGGTPVGGILGADHLSYPGKVLEGVDGVHVITIPSGQPSGELEVRGRQDELYFPRHSHELEGRIFGAPIGSVEVEYRDDEDMPELSIETDLSCEEGIGCLGSVTATLGSVEQVDFDLTRAPADLIAIEDYRPSLLERGKTEHPVYFHVIDDLDSVADGRRRGTLTVSADESGLHRWGLGTSSASFWILDNDQAPLRPQNLRASRGGTDRVHLTWDRPERVAVNWYVIRYRETGTDPWSASTVDRLPSTDDGRFGTTVAGLAAGTSYEFRLKALTANNGESEEATASVRTASSAVLTGFALVDTAAGTQSPLADGATVTVDPDGSYGFVAATAADADLGSVRLALSGSPGAARTGSGASHALRGETAALSETNASARMDNDAPYALYGDTDGAPHGAGLPPGSYTIEATAYALADGDGAALQTLSASFTVEALPALAVADAEAAEGPGETADFAVTLDRPAPGAVTVDYATADGTAVAGKDYEAAAGTLSFGPGETEKTVSVTVLDDVHDDGGETFLLVLSNPTGARLADAQGTATIHNEDALPQAWLVRFGRTAADHAVEAITARFEDPGERSYATFAGRELWSDAPTDADAGGDDAWHADGSGGFGGRFGGPFGNANAGDPFGRPGGGFAGAAGIGGNGGFGGSPGIAAAGRGGAMGAPGGGMRPAPGAGGGVDSPGTGRYGGGMGGGMGGRPGGGGYERTLRDLLVGSGFRLSAGNDGADGEAPWRLTGWGGAATTRFDGVAEGVSVDGEVATFLVGGDAAWNKGLAGISVAHSLGTGSYRDGDGGGSGELESSLTAVHPYARYQMTDRLSAWGVLGYGTGELMLATEDAKWRTDTAMRMAAGGLRGVFLRGEGGLELAAKMDARLTHIASDAASGPGGRLGVAAGGTNRLRLVLEGSRAFRFGEVRMLTPTLEVGVRRDGGDAETGTGIDLGGTLRYADAALGLTAEASGRYLVAHEDDAYREWGASASVRIDPGADRRGLTLSVAPSWGAAATGGGRAPVVAGGRGRIGRRRVRCRSRHAAGGGRGLRPGRISRPRRGGAVRRCASDGAGSRLARGSALDVRREERDRNRGGAPRVGHCCARPRHRGLRDAALVAAMADGTRSGDGQRAGGGANLIFGSKTFIARMSDDSMPPRILDGDYVYVDPDGPVQHGRLVALRDGEAGAMTIRLLVEEEGLRVLRALSGDHPDRVLEADEPTDALGVVVFGGREI